MSKIICDVCGTSYPESATQCPICGCVRSVDARVVAGSTNDVEAQSSGTYTYVKGGRFSKANVKKRNKGMAVTPAETTQQDMPDARESGKKDVGIVITTVFLLLAIVAVVIYIAVRFFGPVLFGDDKDIVKPPVNNETTQGTAVETTEETFATIPCEEVILSKTEITFETEGAALLLNVSVNPAETTDAMQFSSADESVATVSSDGKVTAVSKGETTITVTCGGVSAECKVICNFEVQVPEEETTLPEVDASEALTFNREDFTLNTKGQTWKLYTGDIAANQITWTSDDEKVATIVDGVVTAVGSGTTKVHGEYGGVKLSCIVRCSEAMGKADASAATEATTPATNTEGKYTISNKDVSIYVGDTFNLTLTDEQGNPVDVSWVASDGSVCTVSGNAVTAVATGMITVSANVEGANYSCIVRVYASRG